MAVDQKVIVRSLMRERDKLFAYIWSIVRDTHLADDVLQDVSLLAIEKRGEIADEQHLLGWARLAARNKALEALRTRRRGALTLSDRTLELLDTQWQRHDAEDSSEATDALRACLDELTPHAQQMVRLRYVDAADGATIAQRLGLRVDSVYKAIGRVHRTLGDCVRRRMAGGGGGPGPSRSAQVRLEGGDVR